MDEGERVAYAMALLRLKIELARYLHTAIYLEIEKETPALERAQAYMELLRELNTFRLSFAPHLN